jgi:hypothetical protein
MIGQDLDPFFDLEAFAELATVGAAQVRVIFDDAHEDALGGLVESTGPTLLARSADVAAVTHGTTISLRSKAYKVTGVQPDGTGTTRLMLERSA